MIAWLTYRGELYSVDRSHPQAISVFASERLRGAVQGGRQLEVELAIESCRQARHLATSSRLAGFYAFPDRRTAIRAASEWRLSPFRPDNLTEIEISPDSRVSTLDSEWITIEMGNGAGPWIHHYLAGLPHGTSPLPELVVEGSAAILNTPLRERARGVVEKEWPEALLPLELGRIGFTLGFSLGRMSSAIRPNASKTLEVVYDLSFNAEEPTFLAALKRAMADPTFPVDRKALQPIDENTFFRVPDMRPYMFELS